MPLPKVITTSVIRSVKQGESHGGVYIVDLSTDEVRQVVDWNNASISWEGRGLDRGLRGIAFYQKHIYIAASDEIFVYDKDFSIAKSFRNPYLKHCHEINIHGRHLFLTSTGFDAILIFDLVAEKFLRGYCVRNTGAGILGLAAFDPALPGGPLPGDSLHINYVTFDGTRISFCGTGLQNLYSISSDKLQPGPSVPRGTHNTTLHEGYTLTNDTASDRIALFDATGRLHRSVPVPRHAQSRLAMADIPRDHARQAFARGLCLTPDGLVIGGSSPSTITVYDIENEVAVKSVNLTMDVRNSIHGLEIFPY